MTKEIKTYYDEDAKIEDIKNEKIGIIGYGIQGRAQALNLKDSGLEVLIGNKKDSYSEQIREDGFIRYNIDEVVKNASTIMMLIPDQAHKQVFNDYVKDNLKKGDMLSIAHGYSLRFDEIQIPKYIDMILLAPRMPGDPIRDSFKEGHGIPAFFDVYQDYTGRAKERGLGLAKALGFTKAGVMEVSTSDETEVDLFIEQFMIPSILQTMKVTYDVLVKKGINPNVALMETYASGEFGEVMLKCAKQGLFEGFRKNASPTCQYGISQNMDTVLSKEKQTEIAGKIFENIKNGNFSKSLNEEGKNGYSKLKAYDKANDESGMSKTFKKLKEIIKWKK